MALPTFQVAASTRRGLGGQDCTEDSSVTPSVRTSTEHPKVAQVWGMFDPKFDRL